MSAPTPEPAGLGRIAEIVAGQATALGKHEQALTALFSEIRGVSELVAQIQSMLQPQPTYPVDTDQESTRELTSQPQPMTQSPCTPAETRLPAPQPYAGDAGKCNSFIMQCSLTFPSNGLISILKKRTCLEESSPVNHSPPRSSSKFKVRFSETEALLDNDEVGEDSCLFFLVLCLVTVVISMGGTMIYCFLGGAYSNICTDFSHNMDLCFGFIRRVADTLTHWFIPASS
ncbi:hypothetical protein PDJAM_G00094760 [Pangasius djambal]|uniref:Uncharacterized protein n=1 Tax=Pangasius djambal TaxID=1691987 RepID=A0ACC5Z6P0_9TELE|nr:hypothetical protein [Pangasius djambal]